jgi:hypothetical protein
VKPARQRPRRVFLHIGDQAVPDVNATQVSAAADTQLERIVKADDPQTFARTAKPSAHWLGGVAKAGSLSI